jgi:MerR family transcriptional regulator, heat shock protein HspR
MLARNMMASDAEWAPTAPAAGAPQRRFDDDDFPAYTMGRAAELIDATPAFLRSLGEQGLIEPQRSAGGHRRYSRHQLRLAARARHLVDEGMGLSAACRIVTLEDQLAAARRRIAELEADRR